MTLLGGKPFRRVERQIDAKRLEAIHRNVKLRRRGAENVGNNPNLQITEDDIGTHIRLDTVPTLYRVVSVAHEAGVSSSSSSTDPTASVYKDVKIQQVDASNGDTFGPVILASIAETS